MNQQEVFDKVCSHLMTQKVAAVNSSNSCCYRGEGRTSCAVGCLIPDDRYTPSIEGCGVGSILTEDGSNNRTLLEKLLVELLQPDNDDISLLYHLQAVHDRLMPRAGGSEIFYRTIRHTQQGLLYTAEKFDLKCDFNMDAEIFDIARQRVEGYVA